MEDEDDFGDFGGFEEAEPNENVAQAADVPARASPWAVFPPAVPQSQPDLLCAQNTFPTYLDLSGISGGATSNNVPHHPLDPAEFEELDESSRDTERRANHNAVSDQARIAESVLDGTLAAGVPGLDLAAGHIAARTNNPADICLNTDQGRDNSRNLPDLGVGTGSSLLATSVERTDRPVEEAASNVLNVPVINNNGTVPEMNVESESAESESRSNDRSLSVSPETDNHRVEAAAANDELLSLRGVNVRLEEDLTRTRVELEQQQQRFIEIERRHATELENLRQAGHDTLAVVVEQYKETTKIAILEQQASSARYLEEKLKELTESFHQSMEARNTDLTQQLNTQRASEENRLKEALDASRQEQQGKFDEFLGEEREKHREEIQKVLESERERSHQELQSVIQECQSVAAAKIEEEHVQFTKRLQEQETESKKSTQKSLKEEKEKMKEEVTERFVQEQENSRVAMETVVEQARQQSQNYIREQRQIDSSVRRRHLASLDLFLESARQQIRLLQESDSAHSIPENSNDIEEDRDTNKPS